MEGLREPRAEASHQDHSPVTVTVLRKGDEFAALEEEWEELYEASPQATPFQSWAWLYSWWESYGEDHDLRLVTVREEGGVLVGILPLMVERGGLRRLLFVGTGEGNVLDMLVREGCDQQVWEACGVALLQIDDWWVADLQNLRATSVAWDLVRGWHGPVVRVPQAGSPVIDVKPWDELLKPVSKDHRKSFRRTIRRAEEDGIQIEKAASHEAAQAARRLIALHRESWQGRNIAAEHLTRRWESYMEAAARRMSERGLGAIVEYRRDEEVIAAEFCIFGPEYYGLFTMGASREALKRYQVSSIVVWDGVNTASARNNEQVDLMQGEDPYKLRWSTGVDPVYRMVLGRNISFWLPYAIYRRLRVSIKHYLHSERAPQWVKDYYERVRNLPGTSHGHGNTDGVSSSVRGAVQRLVR